MSDKKEPKLLCSGSPLSSVISIAASPYSRYLMRSFSQPLNVSLRSPAHIIAVGNRHLGRG
jgi:hypothetical protein